MEPAGILKCFMRSVEQLNLRFINFIGDGDSKAYYEVVKANPYGDRYQRTCNTYFQRPQQARVVKKVSARQNPKQRMFEWCCMEKAAERCFHWWKDSRIRK